MGVDQTREVEGMGEVKRGNSGGGGISGRWGSHQKVRELGGGVEESLPSNIASCVRSAKILFLRLIFKHFVAIFSVKGMQ